MKIEKITIDSSVMVSLMIETETQWLSSRKFLDFVLEKKISVIVPISVLFESFHVLRKKEAFVNNYYSFELFRKIMNSDFFNYFDLNIDFFNSFKEINFFNSLKSSDAIIATAAFLNETLLITWDKQLLKNCYHGCTPTDFLEAFA